MRPLTKKGWTVIVVSAGGRTDKSGGPTLSSLKPSVNVDGRLVLLSPPILRIPMLWLVQSLVVTPLMVVAYCRIRHLDVRAVIAASVPYGAVARAINNFLRTALVVDYGDPDYARERGFPLKVLHFLEKLVLNPTRLDVATCIDPNICEYEKRYGVQATFLPPGGFWAGSKQAVSSRTPGHAVVIYAGHIAPPPAYRLDLLIEAAPTILEKQPDARIVFVGEGKYLPELKKRARALNLGDRVKFLGGMSYEKTKEQIAQAAVTVQLLEDMCLGTKVIDYFAAGKAVVSCGRFYDSYREFLANGHNCILVPPDSARLASAIIQLLADPQLRLKLGENALKTVGSYDWDSQANVILDLISESRRRGATEATRPHL